MSEAVSVTSRDLLWRYAGAPLFRRSPHVAHRFRRWLLRSFGAAITPTTKIRRSVRIDRPWNLTAGALAIFGDEAVLRCRGPITVGARCVISQYTVLTTEERDASAPGHPVHCAPIVIEDDVWIATDSLVRPGAHVREGTVVGARALVEGELPAWSICVGQPAVRRGQRVLNAAGETS